MKLIRVVALPVVGLALTLFSATSTPTGGVEVTCGGDNAYAGCICLSGCECGDPCLNGCPKNNVATKTCDQNTADFVGHLTHRMHHNCNNKTSTPDQIFTCAWDIVRKDFGVALDKRAVTRGSANENCLKGKLKAHPDVQAKTFEITGGAPNNITRNRATVDPTSVGETCDLKGAARISPDLFMTPRAMLDSAPSNYNNPPGMNIGLNEGRLKPELRDAAKRGDPMYSLRQSVREFALNNPAMGNAYADLAVTGIRAFTVFRSRKPNDGQLLSDVRAANDPKLAGVSQTALQGGVDKALDRAYKVANALRLGDSPERAPLGWIAVSGEDDHPYRPVNVPVTHFPQYDLDVTVRGIKVRTRYMIAQAKPAARSIPAAPARDIRNDPAPVLEANAEVLLYIHGMDSRLEEAESMTKALHNLANQRNQNYVMISLDLPTSGYADYIDHTRISPTSVLGVSGGIEIFNGRGQENVPVLQFIEDYIVGFVDALEPSTQIKSKLKAIIGGSLGGNMALRLGRRPNTPWIKSVVPWNPGSIWDSLARGTDPGRKGGVNTCFNRCGNDPGNLIENASNRSNFFREYFDSVVGDAANPIVPKQPDMWWRSSWECKPSYAATARVERQEIYNREFRIWHWRLAAEQLIYSHRSNDPQTNQPRYLANTKPMLFACGVEDRYSYAGICPSTQDTTLRMTNTPGKAIFLKDTGHSIHDERPVYFTREIVTFLGM